MTTRRGLYPRAQSAIVWTLGHAVRLWPFVLVAVVFVLSWHTLRQVHTRDVRAALHGLDTRWVMLACALTVLNVAVMGLYDIVAFRHTRARPLERWKYGAVSFAWSNFLTLGPLAGPAIRLWLYRGTVDQLSDLHVGLVSVTIAFLSGLAGWAGALVLASSLGMIAVALCGPAGGDRRSVGGAGSCRAHRTILAARVDSCADDRAGGGGVVRLAAGRVGLRGVRQGYRRGVRCRGSRPPVFLGAARRAYEPDPWRFRDERCVLDRLAPPRPERQRGGRHGVSRDLLRRAVGRRIAACCSRGPRDAPRSASRSRAGSSRASWAAAAC